jgi:hypothetical protein
MRYLPACIFTFRACYRHTYDMLRLPRCKSHHVSNAFHATRIKCTYSSKAYCATPANRQFQRRIGNSQTFLCKCKHTSKANTTGGCVTKRTTLTSIAGQQVHTKRPNTHKVGNFLMHLSLRPSRRCLSLLAVSVIIGYLVLLELSPETWLGSRLGLVNGKSDVHMDTSFVTHL